MPDDPLDRLETAAEAVVRRAEVERNRTAYEQGNRLGLLWIHGLVGLFAGLQMLAWGSATTIEAVVGPWSRLLMATLGTLGGVLLLVGLTRKPRSIPLEAAGLTVVGLWDLLMTLGLMYARISQHSFALRPLTEPLPNGYVAAYPVTVYLGMLALIVVHLWTLRRLRAHQTGAHNADTA